MKPSSLPSIEFAPPTVIRRMIDQARMEAGNPFLGSEIGRLRLYSIITDRQLSAANSYLAVVDRFDKITGANRRLASRQTADPFITDREDDEIIAGLDANGGDLAALAETHPVARTILNAKARHREAVNCLINAGARALQAVNIVVIEDRHIEVGQREYLLLGLTALDNHFRKR
jgi:hypothetical protein